jgi:hypothetical protein
MLKLESIIRSNATAAIHADLVYNNNKTKYQLSLKVFLLNTMLLLKLTCTLRTGGKMLPRKGAQDGGTFAVRKCN